MLSLLPPFNSLDAFASYQHSECLCKPAAARTAGVFKKGVDWPGSELLGASREKGNKLCMMASAISCQIASPAGALTKPSQVDAIETSFQDMEERLEIRTDGRCLTSFKDDMKLVSPRFTLAFVYGTLKRGFGNHWLMQDQMAKGHARFVGVASTRSKFPLVCGPFQVPFLLNIPSKGQRVRGEVYEIDDVALGKLDELEGVGKGHYMRCPIVLTGLHLAPALEPLVKDPSVWKTVEFEAEAYFADSHYTHGMLDAPHIAAYTEEEAATYVRRKDRPQNKSFLEHVYEWIQARDGTCEV